jgi:outer membrane biosynthesis protein TonB
VDPLKAIAEAPKDAKYYSAVSTKAANPEQSNKSDVQVDGNQSRVAKILESQPKLSLATPKVDEPEPAPAKPAPVAVDKPKQEPEPLQPVQKSVEKPKETLVENQPRPKGGKTFGDLAMAKPTTRPDLTGPDDGQEKPTATAQTETPWKRPRTLRDAYSQKGRTGSPGEKLKQAGGVSVQDDIRFDVKGSKFGDYDGRLIDAIRQCWYNDLESLPSQSFPKGDVVVDFVLHYNGKVTDVNISHDGVGNFYSFLSQGAIKKAAPFEPWPQEIRRAVGQDIREIRFTFIYY